MAAFARPAATDEHDTPDDEALQIGRMLSDGSYAGACARFDPTLRRQLPDAALARLFEPRRRERGPVRALRIHDRRSSAAGVTLTIRFAWSRGADSELQLSIGPNGAVTQLLTWDDDDPFERYEPKNELRPPFDGAWTVGNAARDVDHHHYSNPNMRFAIDWVVTDRSGKTFRTDGKKSRDYYAYGRRALCPAAGTVAVAVDGLPDNPVPGIMADSRDQPGNYVVIDIGRGEYVILMHLLTGSIRVKRGERVRAGQMIGRVGSSGHCTEPTLEFELADGTQPESAHSLPVRLVRVLLDDEQAEAVRPVYGNTIAPVRRWNPNGPMHEEDDD